MDALIVAVRTLHFAACVSLAGVSTFECLVAGPALDGSAAVQTLRQRMRLVAWISLALAAISGAAWLAGVAGRMSGEPLGAVFGSGVIGTVLIRTRIGEDWLLRLALIVLLGACMALRSRRKPIRWIALALSAALFASLTWAGHGAADEGTSGTIHLAADLLHLLAAGAWLGGLIPLALLLTAARSGGASAMSAAAAATRRFSLLAVT
ncbi:MAG: hypothetical protein WCF13_10775, partial [Stellaceae bacterium]